MTREEDEQRAHTTLMTGIEIPLKLSSIKMSNYWRDNLQAKLAQAHITRLST